MAYTKEEHRAYMADYRAKNPDKIKAACGNWDLKNPEKRRENSRIAGSRATTLINDAYVRHVLKQQGFPIEAITPELIELKRITIKTKRLCRQLKA